MKYFKLFLFTILNTLIFVKKLTTNELYLSLGFKVRSFWKNTPSVRGFWFLLLVLLVVIFFLIYIFYFVYFFEVPVFSGNAIDFPDFKFSMFGFDLGRGRKYDYRERKWAQKLRDKQYRKDHNFVRFPIKKPPGFFYRMFRVFLISSGLCVLHYLYKTFFG